MDLARLEAALRSLVEDHLIRVIPGQKPEDLVAQRLIQAMESESQRDPGGNRIAPNVYTLIVPTSSLPYWRNAAVMDVLLELIREAGAGNGLRFASPPTLTLADDPAARQGDFRVVASHRIESVGQTQDAAAETPISAGTADDVTLPENAFLIVDGVKEFPLRQPVINIGRRLDNHLVVDDPRVSRHHAQLRAIKGRYVLFDLNSSGGTFINGQRTSQTILYPGDVISLAGVSLIFGQDIPLPQRDLSKTAPRSQAGAERATAIIRPSAPPGRKHK
jgi:hypothetical protein